MDVSNVTFEGIREKIVDYFSTKPEFRDFNFTAPGISTLIDALAYCNHYLIRYANFSLNECFLDSGQLRSSVVSRAKGIGYVPHQYTCSKAKIRIKIEDTDVNIVEGDKVPENSEFIATSSSGSSYSFRNLEPALYQMGSDGFWYADLDIVEGTFVEDVFIQDENYTTRFFLSNTNIDTEHMTVKVFADDKTEESEEYAPIDSILSFTPDSKVYYFQEAFSQSLEVYFGDGVLSKALEPFNVVKIRYLVTSGSAANNIVTFSATRYLVNNFTSKTVKVYVLEASNSGSEREDIDSIRFNAPKYYQRQDRNVVVSDYNSAIISKFSGWVDSVVTWGGEDNEPPQYGTVFICIKPVYTNTLSPTQKKKILDFLSTKNMPCVTPVIIDPEILYVNMSLIVDWKQYGTDLSKRQIIEVIEKGIRDYFTLNITGFKTSFKYSKFLTYVTELEPSIDAVLSYSTLKRYIFPMSGKRMTYTYHFVNRLEEGSVLIGPWSNSGATVQYTMWDKGGVLYLAMEDNKNKRVGTVNYQTGKIEITDYQFDTEKNTRIPIVVKPYSENISISKNFILNLENTTISINAI